ncbi:hypothetical protein [uncultured Jatrophihabitans sp.]|uniref:hypothetical protein n=1 Tax=uncultured Jatrophihabitans sp. TaxID=1610747 RepID=UPI0035CA5B72
MGAGSQQPPEPPPAQPSNGPQPPAPTWQQAEQPGGRPAGAQFSAAPPGAQFGSPGVYRDGQQFGGGQPGGQQFGGGQPGGQQFGPQAPAAYYPTQDQQQARPQYGQFGAPGAPGGAYAQPGVPTRRRRRTPLLIALVAVLVVAAGLITFFAVSGDDPKFTYHGKPVSSPDTVLHKGEATLTALVSKRHGAKNGNTRCYFAQPKKAHSGAKATDVESALRCGPVLFVDGDPARQYLPVPLTQTSTKGGQAKLAPSSSLTDADPVAVSSDTKLARPDGQSAPSGAGGLKVPAPPAAAADTLTAAELGSTSAPKTLTGAVMGAQRTRVTLLAAGTVPRYGTGDAARSAPSGKQLVAFRVRYGGGDVSDAATDKATLTVPGSAPRALPDVTGEDQWIVAVVPSAGAALTLAADGYTQSLSLPDGKPGPGNLAVVRRLHTSAFLFRSFSVPVKLSEKGAHGSLTLHGQAALASLDFWVPTHTNVHAHSTANGLLSVGLSYTRKGSSSRYGFDPQLLRLRLPDGRVAGARNVASAGRVDDVFEVPANFTRGTLEVTGSEKQDGVTIRVTRTTSLTISIPAG